MASTPVIASCTPAGGGRLARRLSTQPGRGYAIRRRPTINGPAGTRRHAPANEHASEGNYRGSVSTDPEQLLLGVA
jgi:hypothetical protein